jgi:hypothetical protein
MIVEEDFTYFAVLIKKKGSRETRLRAEWPMVPIPVGEGDF